MSLTSKLQLSQQAAEKAKTVMFETTSSSIPKSFQDRMNGWHQVFGSRQECWFEQDHKNPNLISICFDTGLRIDDQGDRVSFVASRGQESLQPFEKSNIQFVRQVANHLYRRGDRSEISSIYSSTPYMDAFQQATTEARKHVNDEMIASLKHNNR